MILRIGDSYISLPEDPIIEKRSKLFESVDATRGDFSYDIELPNTSEIRTILRLPSINMTNKIVYNHIAASIIDSDGDETYSGYLRISGVNKTITAAFFSGNYNWISLLSGNLNEIDFSEYDTEITQTVIENSFDNTSGITFPFVDNGALISRSYVDTKLEDFSPGMYVKTIFQKVLWSKGIKFNGDLVSDPIFNRLIVCSNTKSKDQINERSCFVKKTSIQEYQFQPNTEEVITFEDDSTYPYFDGELNNYNNTTSEYVADVAMRVRIEASVKYTGYSQDYTILTKIYRKRLGADTQIYSKFGLASTGGNVETISFDTYMQPGDQIFLKTRVSSLQYFSVDPDSTLKITPLYVFNVAGKDILPNWTQIQFIENVLKCFNVISDYDPYTSTVTFDLFDKLKTKQPIDLSNYINIEDTDFTDFISDFGKKNILGYSNTDSNDNSQVDELKEYNIKQYIKYGQGIINVDNDFLQDSVSLVESDFSAPISYFNNTFGCSMERLNFVEIEESTEFTVSSVSDSSGAAKFNVGSTTGLEDGSLVRIKNSSVLSYDGDWYIYDMDSTSFKCRGAYYESSATAEAHRLDFSFTDSDDVYLLVNLHDYLISNFANIDGFNIESVLQANPAYAYFNLLNTDKQVNTDFTQSLSFGIVDNPLNFQKTVIDSYWQNVQGVLNDPVKLKCTANIPKSIYRQLTPLKLIYIKTEETSGLFYLNSITGYTEQSKPCELELIKL
jgi:hypothetical protein